MRVVLWNPQERVDVPDMVSANFLVLGEFRRTIREVMLGAEVNRIINGFAVEASGPPDTLITVKLNDSGTLSAAIGSENLGSHITYGQLMGGYDDNQNDEGNAQQTLDFNAEAPASYTVQMRFIYSEGTADNRAFWNPTTDTEFVSNENTRHLPGFELRLSGAASNEWIDLATVVWDGASIDSADITDLRTFIFEGAAPYGDTTQAAYAALPDFNRSDTRGASAVGLNEIYPAIRALGRQLADLKGQDEAGDFNFYARTYGPVDPGDALADEQTRSLRTVDVVSFTIGDGSTTFGDFNGATGLEDCLQHIEDMAANTPNSIEIVCKSRATTTPTPFTWPVTTAHLIGTTCDRLSIDYQGHTSTFTHPVASVAIQMTGSLQTLEIRNMSVNAAPTNNSGIFEATKLLLFNCDVVGDSSATSAPAVEGRGGSIFDGCNITGRVLIDTLGGATSAFDLFHPPGVIRGCVISGAVLVTATAAGGIKPTPLHMLNTTVRMHRPDGYGQTAAVDLNNVEACVIDGCTIIYVPNVHAIEGFSVDSHNADNLRMSNTKFRHSDVVPAGTGGFAVNLTDCDNVQIQNCDFDLFQNDGGCIRLEATLNTQIDTCQFRGLDIAGRAAVDSCIYLDGAIDNLSISNCQFDGWNPNTASGNGRCIRADASAAIDQITIANCQFRSNGGYCVQIGSATSATRVVLANNSVTVPEVAGLGFEVSKVTRGAYTGNTMFFTTGASSGIFHGTSGTAIATGNILENGAISVAGAVVWGKLGGGGPTNLNYEF